MSTYSPKKSDIKAHWYIVDAADKVLGRLSSEIARRLKGKHKPTYTPHADMGDYIVVINADRVKVTGNKAADKMYYRHSGYSGGIKSEAFVKKLARNPIFPLEKAVRGMLPKGPLGREMFRKLKVYAGTKHPHEAQQPQPLIIDER